MLLPVFLLLVFTCSISKASSLFGQSISNLNKQNQINDGVQSIGFYMIFRHAYNDYRLINSFEDFHEIIRQWSKSCLHRPHIHGVIHVSGHFAGDCVKEHDTARLFASYERLFQKQYMNDAERDIRRTIFHNNVNKVIRLNILEKATAFYSVNQFTDRSESEYRQMLGLKVTPLHLARPKKLHDSVNQLDDVELPTHFDWREHGAVTPVKNQGQCGSCWAFSVVGNVEGLWKIKHGELYSLSEQEMVDCDMSDSGCNGGAFDSAFEFIESAGGLELEKDYPYTAKNGRCKFHQNLTKVSVKDYTDLPHNELTIKKYLTKHGPITVGINADLLQSYQGGIINNEECDIDYIDHGVLLVGYGAQMVNETSIKYWIIKNSWGEDWGEKGYFRMVYGLDECGVGLMACSAIVG